MVVEKGADAPALFGNPADDVEITLDGVIAKRDSRTFGSGGRESVSVYSVPEIWVIDREGNEHYYRDLCFDTCRENQRIVILNSRLTQKRLALANLSAGRINYADEIDDPAIANSDAYPLGRVIFALLLAWAAYLFISTWATAYTGQVPGHPPETFFQHAADVVTKLLGLFFAIYAWLQAVKLGRARQEEIRQIRGRVDELVIELSQQKPDQSHAQN